MFLELIKFTNNELPVHQYLKNNTSLPTGINK